MELKSQNLKQYNTFGIDAKAKWFAIFESIQELRDLLKENDKKPFLILGGGSNMLFTKDFDGFVLKNELKGIEIIKEDKESIYVKAMAGEIWHSFVMFCIENGLAGVENLSLIPGSVGASPMQNIGAYGVEIKDVFHELEAYHIETGEIHTFTKDACEFGYRESVFKRKYKNQYVILSVTFNLSRNPQINSSYGAIQDELNKKGVTNPTIKNISDAVISIRESKLPNPKEIGNAGSFFKNPVVANDIAENILKNHPNAPVYLVSDTHKKIAAGWLIEQAGWKGKRFGNYGVHEKQALVLVNYGGATGQQIEQLSSDIITDIKNKFGVELEREVNFY